MRNNLSQLISLSKIEEKLYRPADAYEQSRVTRMEHVNTTIVEKPQEGIAAVAARIAKLINRREANGQKTVLSLASGRSMRDLFVELVRLHKEEGLSFKNVVVFGSYEFYPLNDASLGSMGQIKSNFLIISIFSLRTYTLSQVIFQKRLCSLSVRSTRRPSLRQAALISKYWVLVNVVTSL
jgi:glucosamine-6-phosphate deaminase